MLFMSRELLFLGDMFFPGAIVKSKRIVGKVFFCKILQMDDCFCFLSFLVYTVQSVHKQCHTYPCFDLFLSLLWFSYGWILVSVDGAKGIRLDAIIRLVVNICVHSSILKGGIGHAIWAFCASRKSVWKIKLCVCVWTTGLDINEVNQVEKKKILYKILCFQKRNNVLMGWI